MASTPTASAKRVVFTGKQQVSVESFDPGKPEPDHVRVRAHASLMSTGTENIVFNQLFDPGTHWDNWVKYPFYPGYSSVGTIEAIGKGETQLKMGQRVAFRTSHASHSVVKMKDCFPIPDSVPDEQAVWFALAKIASHGAFAAGYSLGDTVLIIGAGPIGQMSVRWARAAGAARIIVVDTAPGRMALAKAGGATATITAPINQARDAILAANDGVLPRVVIDSTGHPAVFSAALGVAANFGKIVVLGDTGTPAQQKLTSDVIMRGLTIVGAHDGHDNAIWNGQTIIRLFYDLVSTGRFLLEGLTSHVFTADQIAVGYATANRDRSATMGLIFDWTGKLGAKK